MRKKVVGVQRELNEIAEELVRQDIEVTDLFDTTQQLDAIVYYNDKNDIVNTDSLENAVAAQNVHKINAAKYNIDQIVDQIKKM